MGFYGLKRDKCDSFGGGKVIEHRADGDIEGHISYAGLNPHHSFVVGWSDGFNRTTQFFPTSWRIEMIDDDTIVCTRTAADNQQSDAPWRTADKYTIRRRQDS